MPSVLVRGVEDCSRFLCSILAEYHASFWRLAFMSAVGHLCVPESLQAYHAIISLFLNFDSNIPSMRLYELMYMHACSRFFFNVGGTALFILMMVHRNLRSTFSAAIPHKYCSRLYLRNRSMRQCEHYFFSIDLYK